MLVFVQYVDFECSYKVHALNTIETGIYFKIIMLMPILPHVFPDNDSCVWQRWMVGIEWHSNILL